MTLADGTVNVDTDFSLHPLIRKQRAACERQGEPGLVLPNPRGRGACVTGSPGSVMPGEAPLDEALLGEALLGEALLGEAPKGEAP